MKRKAFRLLAIVVALIMICGLMACGNAAAPSSTAASSGTAAVSSTAPASSATAEPLEQIEGGNGIVAAKPELDGKVRIAYCNLNELTGPDPMTGRTVYGADELQKWLEADYPNLEFEIIVFPVKDHYTKTKALMEAKQVDVVISSATAQIYQEGYSLDLSPYIESDPEYNIGLHNSERLGTYYRELNPEFPGDDSKRIANCLPFDGAAEIIIYDSELFEQWGVEPISDKPTLDEIYEKAQKMTGINPVTGEQNYGIAFPTGAKPSTWNLAAVVNALGGDIGTYMPNEWDIQIDVSTPEWVQGLEWVKSIQPFTPPGMETEQGMELFLTQGNNIAMKFNVSCFEVFRYEAAGLGDKFEPASRPTNAAGEHSRLGGMRVQVMKDAVDADLAWEIAKWCSVGNGQRFLMQTQTGWPTSIKALGDAEMSPEAKRALEIGSMIMPKSPVDSLSLHTIMIDAIESCTLGGVSPASALAKAESDRQQSYEQLKKAAGK